MRKKHGIWARLMLACLATSSAAAQAQGLPEPVSLPASATALEGRPTIVVNSDADRTERKVLTAEQARENRLLVTIVGGQFFWASRENRPLKLTTSGAFTVLSGPPGSYVRFARVGQKILYVEHVSILFSTITYRGELEVVTGR